MVSNSQNFNHRNYKFTIIKNRNQKNHTKKTLKKKNQRTKTSTRTNTNTNIFNLSGGAPFLEGIDGIPKDMETEIHKRIDVYGENQDEIKTAIQATVNQFNSTRTLTIGMNPSGTNLSDVSVLNTKVGASGEAGAARAAGEERINNILRKSVITYATTHGRSEQGMVEKIHMVPQNVIICFAGILGDFNTDRTYSNHDPKYDKINQWMRNIDITQFRELFQFRSHFGKDNLTVTSNLYYDYFRNSTWYYPGQPYSDLKLVIFSGDSNMSGNFSPIDISFPALTNDSKTIKDVGSEFLNLNISSKPLHSHPFKQSDYQYKLSSAINNMCSKMPLPNGFRLFILPQCRELIHITYEKAKQMLELELYYFHLNHLTDKKAIGEETQKNTKYCFNNSKSLRKKIMVRYSVGVNPLKPVYHLTSGGKVHSYHSQTPSLVDIRERMDNQILEKEENDFRYLNTLSPHKIILFFRNFKSLKKSRGLLNCRLAHPDTDFKTNMQKFLVFSAKNNQEDNYLISKIRLMIETLVYTTTPLLLLHSEPKNIVNMIHDLEIILAQSYILN